MGPYTWLARLLLRARAYHDGVPRRVRPSRGSSNLRLPPAVEEIRPRQRPSRPRCKSTKEAVQRRGFLKGQRRGPIESPSAHRPPDMSPLRARTHPRTKGVSHRIDRDQATNESVRAPQQVGPVRPQPRHPHSHPEHRLLAAALPPLLRHRTGTPHPAAQPDRPIAPPSPALPRAPLWTGAKRGRERPRTPATRQAAALLLQRLLRSWRTLARRAATKLLAVAALPHRRRQQRVARVSRLKPRRVADP
mmetsp:Transcript_6057/g.18622  ORF Transcript_6057/g.18622 Transcript_6057/m.18622 type:complete len:248 (-) Transcript_6057:1520-2263(-)